MSDEIYQQLCKTMTDRGGLYPGMDIPEFYELTKELFTPVEAAVANAMHLGFHPASAVAEKMGKKEEDLLIILDEMAQKGLCQAGEMGGIKFYGSPAFVPGIFEFSLMAGTTTERDKRIAKLIYAYKSAVDGIRGPRKVNFPDTRVITVDRMITTENKIHTYDQVASYIEKSDPLSVSTCFCRHAAKLIDENDDCGVPDDVCLQFGMAAQFCIDRGVARKISKEEALKILIKSEEAGLVHAGMNKQELDFLCNCCSCHCMLLKLALAQPKPGIALASGFKPIWDAGLCTACETCIDRCPATAISLNEDKVAGADLDRCIGCGVCATGCPSEAIAMEKRPGVPAPPVNQQALEAAMEAGR